MVPEAGSTHQPSDHDEGAWPEIQYLMIHLQVNHTTFVCFLVFFFAKCECVFLSGCGSAGSQNLELLLTGVNRQPGRRAVTLTCAARQVCVSSSVPHS